MKPELNDFIEAPLIDLGFFKMWVHDLICPTFDNSLGGNWLHITASCENNGAKIVINGKFLHLSEVQECLKRASEVNQSLSGTINLGGIEPNLKICMTVNKLGQLLGEIQITPDHINQQHIFKFLLDQSYLLSLIQGCQRILALFP